MGKPLSLDIRKRIIALVDESLRAMKPRGVCGYELVCIGVDNKVCVVSVSSGFTLKRTGWAPVVCLQQVESSG